MKLTPEEVEQERAAFEVHVVPAKYHGLLEWDASGRCCWVKDSYPAIVYTSNWQGWLARAEQAKGDQRVIAALREELKKGEQQ